MVEIGNKVKMLSNHWCRPGAEGIVVKREEAGDLTEDPSEDRWLIHFAKKGVGLGGHLLFCHEKEFKVIA